EFERLILSRSPVACLSSPRERAREGVVVRRRKAWPRGQRPMALFPVLWQDRASGGRPCPIQQRSNPRPTPHRRVRCPPHAPGSRGGAEPQRGSEAVDATDLHRGTPPPKSPRTLTTRSTIAMRSTVQRITSEQMATSQG